MVRTSGRIFTVACCLAAAVGLAAAQSTPTSNAAIVDRIDELLLERLRKEGVDPAPRADDAEFLRRVWLDLAGVIPRVSQTREFLEDESADKRSRLVDRLLSNPATLNHLAEVWRNAMLPAEASPELLGNSAGLHAWLREQFANNLRYDRVVSDLIAATGGEADGPALFFTALNLEPKKIAAATARIFLGLQIECAECHDHPFDDWKQEDFWAYAAFFARLPAGDMRGLGLRLNDQSVGEVTLPDTDRVVSPKFPGGRSVGPDEAGTRRQQLSIWMASPENPYLARAAVNRVWALLFGRGLVHPVDDLGRHNPASHPELLTALTDYFVDSGYDLKNLLRILCSTQAYGRTSRIDPATRPRPDLFATMAVKVLSAEQLYDSLQRCLSQNADYSAAPGFEYAGGRQMFLARMATRTADPTSFDRGLQQALHMMNGGETAEATDLQRGPLLMSLEAPFLSDDDCVEVLFLASLSRYPRPDEFARVREFVSAAVAATDQSRSTAYADILWALLNSAEFVVNH